MGILWGSCDIAKVTCNYDRRKKIPFLYKWLDEMISNHSNLEFQLQRITWIYWEVMAPSATTHPFLLFRYTGLFSTLVTLACLVAASRATPIPTSTPTSTVSTDTQYSLLISDADALRQQFSTVYNSYVSIISTNFSIPFGNIII